MLINLTVDMFQLFVPKKNCKSVPIAGGEDKRAITATFVETLDCKFLPMQLIYGEKTSQLLPKTQFP